MPRTLEDGTEVFTAEELQAKLEAEVEGLKRNQQAALDETKAAKKERDALREQWGDLDPKEVKALLAERSKNQRAKAEEEGNFEILEKNLKDAHAKELKAREAREQKLMATVQKSLVSAKLTAAIAEAKGNTKLLLPHAEKFVDVRETDDGFEAFVLDGHGNPAVADGQGTPMSFEQLVETQLLTQFPDAFAGTGSSGSGASKSVDGVGGRTTVIAADDNGAFIGNLESIAAGETEVR